MFEADLGEIGRATSRGEAMRRADVFRQRTRGRVGELIQAIAGSTVLDVDATAVPGRGSGGDARPPTAAMIAFATAISEGKGLKLPRGLKSDGGICRAFLDEHAGQRAPRETEGADGAGPRRPTPAMLRYAEKLAQELGRPLPAAAADDFATCKQFLDAHARGRGTGADGAEPPAKPRSTQQTPASKRSPAKKRTG